MDGIEPLQNVVVILASNRGDLIDPAILRPGRIDRKIKVNRPNQAGAQRIYDIYLKETLPLAEPKEVLARVLAESHYARTPENQFLEIVYRSGKRASLSRRPGQPARSSPPSWSGPRAWPSSAPSNENGDGAVAGRFAARLAKGIRRNDLFPPTDITEDWLKLTDFDPTT